MCRYFQAPKSEIVAELNARQVAASEEIGHLKASKEALEKGIKGVEGELRELLQSSPALAHHLASRQNS